MKRFCAGFLCIAIWVLSVPTQCLGNAALLVQGRLNVAPVTIGLAYSPRQQELFFQAADRMLQGLELGSFPQEALYTEATTSLSNQAEGILSPEFAALQVLTESLSRPWVLEQAAQAFRRADPGGHGERTAGALEALSSNLAWQTREERLSWLQELVQIRREILPHGFRKADALAQTEIYLNALFNGERQVRLLQEAPVRAYALGSIRPVAGLQPATPETGVGPHGFFGPESAIQKFSHPGSKAMIGQALLMQMAHPLVAAGISSKWRERMGSFRELFRRIFRTSEKLISIIYGSRHDALAVGQEIQAIHKEIRTELKEAVGRYPAGTKISAEQPELLMWVLATLYQSRLSAYLQWHGQLTEGDKDRYYADFRFLGELVGVPSGYLPLFRKGFEAYWREMISGGHLAVDAHLQMIPEMLRRPPLAWYLRPILALPIRIFYLFTIGLLPQPVRALYRVPWHNHHQTMSEILRLLIGVLLPLIPLAIRLAGYLRKPSANKKH